MIVVIDVSAVFALLLKQKGHLEILHCLNQADVVLAPGLYHAEAINTAWKYHQFKNFSREDTQLMAETAIGLVDDFVADSELWREALVLASEVGHSAYDCLYLQLARERRATLLTLDKELKRLAEEIGIDVLK